MTTPKTPLRYPGGKQKIWRFVREVLEANELLKGHYVEPYAGGAGVAMELLLRNEVSRVHLNDSCPAVYAFWHSILRFPEEFCRRIACASLTVEEWKRQRNIFRERTNADRMDLGFATFYLNRCNRSGILSAGLIGGLNQNGKWKIDARFSRGSLIARIEAIAMKRRCVRIRNWDAEKFIANYLPRLPQETLVYYDPPYFNKSDRLYPNSYSREDHARIARKIQNDTPIPWMVSYDSCPQVRRHYELQNVLEYRLQYNAGKSYLGREIFIFPETLRLPRHSSFQPINAALKATS